MARKPTGSLRWLDGVPIARVRLRNKRPSFAMPNSLGKQAAAERGRMLALVAKQLRERPNIDEAAGIEALRAVANASSRKLPAACRAVSELLEAEVVLVGAAAETVEQYAERWIAARAAHGIKEARGNDGSRLKTHIFPVIGSKPIALIDMDDIRSVVESLDQGTAEGRHSWATAGKVWATVAKLFADSAASKVADLRVRDDNPAAGVAKPDRGARKTKQWLFPSEMAALLACDGVPAAWSEVYAVASYLYLRPGELFALSWGAVHIDERFVDVQVALDLATGEIGPPKTKTGRRVPIAEALVPLLQRMQVRAEFQGPVVNGRSLPAPSHVHGVPDDLAGIVRGHLIAAGINRRDLHVGTETSKRFTFYDMRSTGITWEALRGTDPTRIMHRAGHTNFSTTLGYIRTAEAVGLSVGEPFGKLPEEMQ